MSTTKKYMLGDYERRKITPQSPVYKINSALYKFFASIMLFE